jgi:hypothetical protein
VARSRGSSERTQFRETNSLGASAFEEDEDSSSAPLAYFSTTRLGSLNSL